MTSVLASLRSLGRQARPVASGLGLELRPWDRGLVAQMAAWGEHGFPYSAFDLAHLADRQRAQATLERMRQRRPHLHFVACEDGVAVGRASVNLEDKAGLYLWSVHVPPEHEGRGICRRMLAVFMRWLEAEYPGRDFVLTSNTFATRAHRAYEALGFAIVETRWQYDRELASELLKRPPEDRTAIAEHIRWFSGRWEVRAHVFARKAGTPLPWPELQPRQLARSTP
jgi:RimJ/RimL family protein N-acetyltransferase